jgi:hypothetical protein
MSVLCCGHNGMASGHCRFSVAKALCIKLPRLVIAVKPVSGAISVSVETPRWLSAGLGVPLLS